MRKKNTGSEVRAPEEVAHRPALGARREDEEADRDEENPLEEDDGEVNLRDLGDQPGAHGARVGADVQDGARGSRLGDEPKLGRGADRGGPHARGVENGIQGIPGRRRGEGEESLHSPQADGQAEHGEREERHARSRESAPGAVRIGEPVRDSHQAVI